LILVIRREDRKVEEEMGIRKEMILEEMIIRKGNTTMIEVVIDMTKGDKDLIKVIEETGKIEETEVIEVVSEEGIEDMIMITGKEVQGA